MKEYAFETVGYRMSPLTTKLNGRHRELIEEYAKKGYLYVGFIPTELAGGNYSTIDLIFEKDV